MNPTKQAIAVLMMTILCIGNINATVTESAITTVSDTASSIANTTDISTGIAIVAGMCALAATVNCIYLANKEETQNVKETISKTILAYCAGATALIAVLCMTDPTDKTTQIQEALNNAYEETFKIVTDYCLI